MGVLVVHLEQTPASGTVSLSRQNTALGHQPKWPNGSEWHFLLGIFAKLAYAPPHICASTRLAASDRTDKADDFLAESHSRTQDPGVRFEGWRGLPKMNQASPREAGHKPAF